MLGSVPAPCLSSTHNYFYVLFVTPPSLYISIDATKASIHALGTMHTPSLGETNHMRSSIVPEMRANGLNKGRKREEQNPSESLRTPQLNRKWVIYL